MVLAAIAAMAFGCRYRPGPVPVLGSPGDLAQLAGDWEGEYSSPVAGRRGSIVFKITAQGDSAFGDVLMPVLAGEIAPRPVDLLAGHELHARSMELLAIKFVTVSGGSIQGELEPYIAPDCDCLARTTFYGRVEGNGISGSFVTTTERGIQRGEWSVRRVSR
jgi:hypothetical protein